MASLALAAFGFAALSLLFWKLRILDSAVIQSVTIPNADLFVGQAPMTAYAFAELRSGHLPLWNPYQLCGEPFLAVPYVGLFYPPNWIYLFVDVPTGVEVSFLLHMLLGALGMWVLVRRLGLGWLPGLAAGLTFAWSGFPIHWANQPQLFAGLAWAPWTIACTDAALNRRRWGAPALAGVVACQALNGAMEILLHTLYLAGAYAAVRLVAQARREGARAALAPAAAALGGVVLGVALAAVQLVPSLELVAQSARAPGRLGFDELVLGGRLAPADFARSALASQGLSSTGVLSLVAFALAAGLRRQRTLWAFCLGAGGLALGVAFGGELFRLYTLLPVGSLFRRPYKFLDVYDFAQALLVALAVAALLHWASLPRGRLWRHPGFALAVGWGILLSLVLAVGGQASPALLGLTTLLVAYGAAGAGRLRVGIVAGLVVLHAASLFTGVGNRYVRPIHLPDYAAEHAARNRIDVATSRLGHERIYLSPSLWFMKQGLVQRVPVVADYEPLAPARYADFFEAASGFRARDRPFNGRYFLTPRTRWPMMDLTGTRFYVLNPWDLKLQGLMHREGAEGGFEPVAEAPRRVIERTRALPRAWVVGAARTLASAPEVLATLADGGFDPRAEVLLEAPAAGPSGAPGVAGEARIVSYAPEEVVVAVEAERAAWLVLSDFFYPGWQAQVDGRATAIARGDYLFRAVPVAAGRSEVRFSYRPLSLRVGAGVTLGAVGVLAAALAWSRRC